VRQVGIGRDHSTALTFAPDGRTLASAGTAAAITLWDVESGTETEGFVGHRGGTLAAAFAPDGRVLASAGRDRMIRLWEVASRKERRVFGGHPALVRSLAYTPDGRFLAAGHADGVVRLWDAVTGKLLYELPGHRGAVTGLTFARQGHTLVTGSQDTTVLLWEVGGLLRGGRMPAVQLSDAELKALWERLSSPEAADVSLAMQTLTRAQDQAVAFAGERVEPVSGDKVTRWLADLDSDHFAVRERATKELTRLGKFAEPALRRALRARPSLEVRRRIEGLLNKLSGPHLAPEYLRAVRAVEVLEMIGTPQARKVLERLATGAAEAELTGQAKAALRRLK
jgi:WD domain, G-beta repeat